MKPKRWLLLTPSPCAYFHNSDGLDWKKRFFHFEGRENKFLQNSERNRAHYTA